MNRSAKVNFHGQLAGLLAETDSGYMFEYEATYVQNYKDQAISKTLPVTLQKYESKVLFPFFDGLIPEGWLLNIAINTWKVTGKDRFGLLLACCKNSIGAVSVIDNENEEL